VRREEEEVGGRQQEREAGVGGERGGDGGGSWQGGGGSGVGKGGEKVGRGVGEEERERAVGGGGRREEEGGGGRVGGREREPVCGERRRRVLRWLGMWRGRHDRRRCLRGRCGERLGGDGARSSESGRRNKRRGLVNGAGALRSRLGFGSESLSAVRHVHGDIC
jgi:hypothetical protein